jgi:hypothetical protein
VIVLVVGSVLGQSDRSEGKANEIRYGDLSTVADAFLLCCLLGYSNGCLCELREGRASFRPHQAESISDYDMHTNQLPSKNIHNIG